MQSNSEQRTENYGFKQPKKKSFLGRLFNNCLMVIAGLLFIIVVIVIILIGVFVVRYESWRSQQGTVLREVATDEVPHRSLVQKELYGRLDEFQHSSIQKESLELNCPMLNVLVEDIAKENWGGIDQEDIGVECGDRHIKIYVKTWGMWWVIVSVWQRAAGDVDFVVYDVEFGPFSLAGLTFGHVSGEISRGLQDASGLVTGEDYSGRRVTEVYLHEVGVRIVGEVE